MAWRYRTDARLRRAVRAGRASPEVFNAETRRARRHAEATEGVPGPSSGTPPPIRPVQRDVVDPDVPSVDHSFTIRIPSSAGARSWQEARTNDRQVAG